MTRQYDKLIKEKHRWFRRHFASLEQAVTFLEEDPRGDGSGYAKAAIIKLLTQIELKEPYHGRLQDVVITVVDKMYRQEFRWYCRLAHKVDSPALRNVLINRLESQDKGIRRRSQWVLEYLWMRDAYTAKTKTGNRNC